MELGKIPVFNIWFQLYIIILDLIPLYICAYVPVTKG